MTATTIEVEEVAGLDETPPCWVDGCKEPAAYRCRNRCGCHLLLCTPHALGALRNTDRLMASGWRCRICKATFDDVYGRDVCRIEPL